MCNSIHDRPTVPLLNVSWPIGYSMDSEEVEATLEELFDAYADGNHLEIRRVGLKLIDKMLTRVDNKIDGWR